MSTWINDIISAMNNLGGTAHYSDLYAEIKRIRNAPLPNAWKKIVQRQIQDHARESSGFKSKKLFYPVNGLGSGTWGLLSAPIVLPPSTELETKVATGLESLAAAPKPRNATWSRDELILALQLYVSHRKSPLGKDSVEVKKLSICLNKMNATLGQSTSETFRNTNGVYMKMMNFRRFDPDYIARGKVGLTRGNKDEELVWLQFAHDPIQLDRVASAIRLALEQAPHEQLKGNDEPGIQEAQEGRVLTRLHRYRERNRAIVEERKKLALKTLGYLACEACGFDFSTVYGNAGNGLIDVHHTKPVHTLTEGEKTKLEDLALLCANCHRVVHSSRKWLTVHEVRLAFQKNAKAD